MQTRKHSAVETLLNTASGFVVSWGVWYVLAPVWGVPRDAQQTTSITVVFTVVSIVRSYAWRRIFNHYQKREVV